MNSTLRLSFFIVCATGCEGLVESPTRPEPELPLPETACIAGQPLSWGLRRLTHDEYDRTTSDLFGATLSHGRTFPGRGKAVGFTNNVSVLAVDEGLSERYATASEELAALATERIVNVQCRRFSSLDTCARAELLTFAELAWRGPLSKEEAQRLGELYDGLRQDGFEGREATEAAASFVLQAPRFLYRVEGLDGALSTWDLANRLSYFLQGTMPDAPLRAAAADGTLAQPSTYQDHAGRLMRDDRSAQALASFYTQWLGVDELELLEKDPELSPDFSTLAPSLREEVARTAIAAHHQGPSLKAFLTTTSTFVDDTLAADRGLPTTGAWSTTTHLQPGGILTLQGVMAAHAHSAQTSPVRRGLFISRSFFCREPPPPPADVAVIPPDPDPSLSTRERFAEHSSNAACSGCHRLMDPAGLPFEHYDAVGQWRATEGPHAIDARGELVATDVDGEVDGPGQLAAKIASSQRAQKCFATQWVRFATGHAERTADACVIDQLTATLTKGANIDEVLLQLVTSQSFTTREIAP